ncbi:MAG: hypothetical protein KBT15_06450 [Bacteroidales bacterium]|nr:hypothetical protein [Candidatus Minthousia equi]
MNTKEQFSENLFWDVRFEDIDFQKHASYVVQRVLEYGADKDWKQLVSMYGLDRIGQIAMSLRSLEPRAMSFIAAITHHSKEQFRCYTLKQSNQQPWDESNSKVLKAIEKV